MTSTMDTLKIPSIIKWNEICKNLYIVHIRELSKKNWVNRRPILIFQNLYLTFSKYSGKTRPLGLFLVILWHLFVLLPTTTLRNRLVHFTQSSQEIFI